MNASTTPFPYTTLFRSDEEQHRARHDQRQRELLLVLVQPRRDERPRLVEHVGQRDHEADQRGDLHRHRSEEHTSELQSPCNLVCRLLLEKKKNKKYNTL